MDSFKDFYYGNKRSGDPGYNRMGADAKQKIDPKDRIISFFETTGLMDKYRDATPPGDEETHDEMKHLMERMRSLSPERQRFALEAEVDEHGMYRRFAKTIGLNLPPGYTENITKQIDPILMYLKAHHNRARPEQFASANNIPFKPSIPHDVNHAAYPSGHALDSHIIGDVFRKLKPTHAQAIDDFAKRMRESRLDGGIHYPSDNLISHHLANDILRHGLIRIPAL